MRRREFITLLGGAAASASWPLAVYAQQPLPVIGFMSARSPQGTEYMVEAFRRGLREGAVVEGENATIEFAWASGDYSRLPAFAADLVGRRVAVIAAVGGEPSALAAKRATSTIPIVFGIGGDPVSEGLVESFNRPGGNVTGITLLTSMMEQKRLSLLRELAPGVGLIGVLVNPRLPQAAVQLREIEQAARPIGQRIVIARASTDEELVSAFASLVRDGIGALLVAADPYFDTRRGRILEFTANHRLPAIYQFREYALGGGILSYGISITDAYRLIGLYTAKIVKGAKPADLPVQQANKFELIVNLRTAKALGITVSDNLLSLADEVIE